MDDNEHYFKYQDIIQAFSKSKPPWLYGHNIDTHDSRYNQLKESLNSADKQCTYFQTIYVNSTKVKFSKYQMEHGKMEPKLLNELYGTFFQTPGRAKEDSRVINRTTPNGVFVSYSPDVTTGQKYKLLLSDYKDCSLIRPFFPDTNREDHTDASYHGTGGVCIVLLSDGAARKMGTVPAKYKGPVQPKDLPGGLPKECAAVYPNMCGTERKFTVVFNTNCPKIPNPLGC